MGSQRIYYFYFYLLYSAVNSGQLKGLFGSSVWSLTGQNDTPSQQIGNNSKLILKSYQMGLGKLVSVLYFRRKRQNA